MSQKQFLGLTAAGLAAAVLNLLVVLVDSVSEVWTPLAEQDMLGMLALVASIL